MERWSAFHDAVARLAPEEREVFGLTFYHGWSQAQIADELHPLVENVLDELDRWLSVSGTV